MGVTSDLKNFQKEIIPYLQQTAENMVKIVQEIKRLDERVSKIEENIKSN